MSGDANGASPVLVVDRLGKAYRKYRSEGRRVLAMLGLPVAPVEEHWVLRDVGFSVLPGEAVGIVGQNGAGKSTLLKMITGTLRPTEGSVAVGGRVAAILELGMGFNPEFTGRQNVLHSGGLMGLARPQLEAAMPEIEAFAEIGEYFDQPVRTYSSGMMVRVAFSVATAFRPDVLIVDEALSVGDTYFQHKSFDRIRQFRSEGSTLLIVSHDASAIQTLCSRAIVLDGGRMVLEGSPQQAMDFYNALVAEREARTVRTAQLEDGRVQTSSGTGEARFQSLELLDDDGLPLAAAAVGQRVRLRATVAVHDAIEELVFGFLVKDRLGRAVYGTNTWHKQKVVAGLAAGEVLEFLADIPIALGPGSYSFSVALTGSLTHLERNFEWRDLALMLDVYNPSAEHFEGLCRLDVAMDVRRLPSPANLPQRRDADE